MTQQLLPVLSCQDLAALVASTTLCVICSCPSHPGCHVYVNLCCSARPGSMLSRPAAVPFTLPSLHACCTQGVPKNPAKLSEARKSVGFDRTMDGRVMLFSDDGEPFQVKNDMGVPGALLLRWESQAGVTLSRFFATLLEDMHHYPIDSPRKQDTMSMPSHTFAFLCISL